jgi:hypothetical protein
MDIDYTNLNFLARATNSRKRSGQDRRRMVSYTGICSEARYDRLEHPSPSLVFGIETGDRFVREDAI